MESLNANRGMAKHVIDMIENVCETHRKNDNGLSMDQTITEIKSDIMLWLDRNVRRFNGDLGIAFSEAVDNYSNKKLEELKKKGASNE